MDLVQVWVHVGVGDRPSARVRALPYSLVAECVRVTAPSPPPPMSRGRAHASLQVIVLLWGATAILGRQISISAVSLVWYRLLICVIALVVLVRIRKLALALPLAKALRYAAVGAIIGLHWVCFYGAIKVAGIATAVLTLSTVAFFTAIVEPIVFRRPVVVAELVLGALVVVGAALLLQLELDVDAAGLALGLGSALFAAVFGTLNGKLAHAEPPERLMLYELAAAAVTVTLCFVPFPATFVAPWELAAADVGWLVVLGIACTVIPQVWIIHVLRTLSPFTVALTVNLEPVYALILSVLIFPDDSPLTVRFYVGTAFLLALVLANARLRARR